MLAPLGDVAFDEERRADIRRARFRVEAPGHGLSTIAVFEYRERYLRIARGWLRDGYGYEYRRPLSRMAHHDHPPIRVHQHCRTAGRPEERSPYEDRVRLLEEAHDEFRSLHLLGSPIDCGGLRPLT